MLILMTMLLSCIHALERYDETEHSVKFLVPSTVVPLMTHVSLKGHAHSIDLQCLEGETCQCYLKYTPEGAAWNTFDCQAAKPVLKDLQEHCHVQVNLNVLAKISPTTMDVEHGSVCSTVASPPFQGKDVIHGSQSGLYVEFQVPTSPSFETHGYRLDTGKGYIPAYCTRLCDCTLILNLGRELFYQKCQNYRALASASTDCLLQINVPAIHELDLKHVTRDPVRTRLPQTPHCQAGFEKELDLVDWEELNTLLSDV